MMKKVLKSALALALMAGSLVTGVQAQEEAITADELVTVAVSEEEMYGYDLTGTDSVDGRIGFVTPTYIIYPNEKVDAAGAAKVLNDLDMDEHIAAYNTVAYVVNPIGDAYDNEVDGAHYIEVLKTVFSTKFNSNIKVIGIGEGATFVNNVVALNAWSVAGIMTYGGSTSSPDPVFSVPAYISGSESSVVDFYVAANKAEKVAEVNGITTYVNAENEFKRVVVNENEETLAEAFANAWDEVLSKNYRMKNNGTPGPAGVNTWYMNDITTIREEYELVSYVNYEELEITPSSHTAVITENATEEVPNFWYEYLPYEMTDAEDATYPLVVLLHGNGNDNRTQPETSGWIEKAGEERFVCIAPEWQATGNAIHGAGQYTALGEDGVVALVEMILEQYPQIDASRVYVCGLSAGARNSYAFGINHPTLFTAVEGSSAPGFMNVTSVDAAKETKMDGVYLPVYLLGGTHDEYTPFPVPEDGSGAYNTIKAYAYMNDIEVPEMPDLSVNPYFGVEMDNQGWDTIKETKIYSGTLANEDGVLMKAVTMDHYGHWNNKQMIDDIWEFFSSYQRDPETHKIIFVNDEVKRAKVSGDQKVVIVGDDYGPTVSKTVITLDAPIDASSLSVEDIVVAETKQGYAADYSPTPTTSNRTIKDIYLSDEAGNKVNVASGNIVTIEMGTSPSEGGAFYYALATGRNDWHEYYSLDITLVGELTSNGILVSTFDVAADIDLRDEKQRMIPQLTGVEMDAFTASSGTKLSYASYEPAKDNKKNPLVIWLHGAGEGGTDPHINMLGNEVSVLVGAEFQETMDGAYVLAPQSPTMWADDGKGGYCLGHTSHKGDEVTDSIYVEDLTELIKAYIAANKDIDANRVLIGGCSNGGYMTIRMLLEDADLYAGAYLCAESFMDAVITDEQIKELAEAEVGMWFVHATKDSVHVSSIPTYKRLKEAGKENLHLSEYESVFDTTGRYPNADGSPYEYNAHWSWIYFFNNEAKEGNLAMWDWMADQARTPVSVETGDDTNIVPFVAMGAIALIAGGFILYKKRKEV